MSFTQVTPDALKRLSEEERHRCVSIYLRTAESGVETLQGPVRLRKLLRRARAQLVQSGLKEHAADALLEPAANLVGENPFWQFQRRALALFMSSGFFAGYQLPYPVPDLSIVSLAYHLKPLLPLVAEDNQYLILAVSRNQVRLFRAGPFAIEELELDGIPTSEAEALQYDDPEKSLHTHSGAPIGGLGLPAGIVHGHGAAGGHSSGNTFRFFRRLGAGLRDRLKGERAPLLLASVEHYLPLLRETTRYPNIVDQVLTGNHDHASADELRSSSWKLMEPLLSKSRIRAHEAMEAGLANRNATDDVNQAVLAACQGRARTCFVALDEEIWGDVNESKTQIRRLEPSQLRARDLLDLAASRTFLHGGHVIPVPSARSVPGETPVAVLMRY